MTIKSGITDFQDPNSPSMDFHSTSAILCIVVPLHSIPQRPITEVFTYVRTQSPLSQGEVRGVIRPKGGQCLEMKIIRLPAYDKLLSRIKPLI